MRILGIDPGTAITGFGLIEVEKGNVTFIDCGCITTHKGDAMPDRLLAIATDLRKLVKQLKPDEVAIEKLFFAKNVTTAMTVSQARGVILATVAEQGVPIAEYTPLQVKQALTGYGRAEKKQIQQMVKVILNLRTVPKPDDAADALAIAITHAQSRKFLPT